MKKCNIILCVAMSAISLLATEIKIAPDKNNQPAGWFVRTNEKNVISCEKETIKINSPQKIVMIQSMEKVPSGELKTVLVRAEFQGKGEIQVGYHIYSKKGYITTSLGKKTTFESMDKFTVVGEPRIIGFLSCGLPQQDSDVSHIFPCVYIYPGTEGLLRKITCDSTDYKQDTNAPISNSPSDKNMPAMQRKLLLPDTVYAVPGIETNIYFDNVFLAPNTNNFAFEVICSKGRNYKNRWSFVPTEKDVGKHDLFLNVFDANGIVAKGRVKIAVAPGNAGTGRKISLLMIGDSITDITLFPTRVHALFKRPGNPVLTMIGTRPAPAANGAMVHEGYSGWKWNTFFEKGSFVTNQNGLLVLDFKNYFEKNNGGKAPDFITIQLGVNDIFRDYDFMIFNSINSIEKDMDKFINALRTAAPDAEIGIGIPTLGAAQDAFGRVYGCLQTTWQYKKNIFMLGYSMMKKYKNHPDKKISLIPIYVNLDCENNFPTAMYPVNEGNPVQISGQSDGVHPAPAGANQLGDALYAWMKNQLAKQKK